MLKVLIVDDNESDREGLKDFIDWDSLGIGAVVTAKNGQDGFEKAIELVPDIILSDISMPVYDGIEMMKRIKQEISGVSFLFMSLFSEIEYLQSAINLKAETYILKPIDIDSISAVILKMVHEKLRRDEKEKKEIDLLNQIKSNMPILQENLIKELFLGTQQNNSEVLNHAKFLNVNFCENIAVFIVEIDKSQDNMLDENIKEKYMFLYEIRNCISEILGANAYFAIMQQERLSVIFTFNIVNQNEANDYLVENLNMCKDRISDEINLSTTFGVGGIVTNINDIEECYKRAKKSVEFKFHTKGNQILFSDEILLPEYNDQIDLEKIKADIIIAIENDTDIPTFIDKYFDSNSVKYSQNYIKSFAFTVVNIIQLYLLEKKVTFENVFTDNFIIWDKLLRFDTIIDVRQWLFNIIKGVREYFSIMPTGKYTQIVNDIKQNIDTNYSTIKNVIQAIENIYISYSHANLIFKNVTGVTIFEYLIDKRISVAKELLKDPYNKIYEVADKVGYSNTTNFSAVFKSTVGMTPKEYRDGKV